MTVKAPLRNRQNEMATAETVELRFAPSAVEGLPGVTEAAIYPDRLELCGDAGCVVIRFLNIARWHRCGWLYRPLARLGFGVRGWASVGDRDWFHPPSRRFFRFYTEPPITIYMPDEPNNIGYGETMFRSVQNVIGRGGYSTLDLG